MKKSGPNPLKKIKIPLYGGHIWFFTDVSAYNEASNQLDEDSGESHERGVGMTRVYVDEEDRRIYMVGVFDKGLQTLVHELGHVTIIVCEYAGIDPRSGNGEPFCYLLDYLFAEFAPILMGEAAKA